MSRLYIATPHAAAGTVTDVATGIALKTVLQIGVPATTQLIVYGWGVSFDGQNPTDPPIDAYLIETDTAATVTALTMDNYGHPSDLASSCVGGTALTGYNASAEGTIAASRVFDAQEVHPQTGYSLWFPADARPKIAPSKFLRIRVLAAATVNCHPWIVIDE
jgi:hypothetical protein